MMINHLLQGLPDQSIAYEVLMGKPRTLFQAVDMIKWHECRKETEGRKHLSMYHNSDQSTISREVLSTLEVRRINWKRSETEEPLLKF